MESRGWIITVPIIVGVIPLRAFAWERIDDAVTLIGGVVAVVVLINVSVPIVNAFVIPTVCGHNVDAVWAPCKTVDDSTVVAVAAARTTAGPWAAEGVNLYT